MSGYVLDGEPVQGQTLAAGGGLTDHMTVYWRTEDGAINGSVRVPLDGDWPSAAADLINTQLDKLRQVGAA